MVGTNTMTGDETRGQNTRSLKDMPYMPATVHDHTEQSNGVTLHTIDKDPDSDIEVYNDERPPHRSGNPPEEAQ